MKIKFLTRAAGPDGIRKPGDIDEVSQAEARQLVDAGYAEALEPFDKHVEAEKPEPKAKSAKK